MPKQGRVDEVDIAATSNINGIFTPVNMNGKVVISPFKENFSREEIKDDILFKFKLYLNEVGLSMPITPAEWFDKNY